MGIKRARVHVLHSKTGRWHCLTCGGFLHERRTLADHVAAGHRIEAYSPAAKTILKNLQRRYG